MGLLRDECGDNIMKQKNRIKMNCISAYSLKVEEGFYEHTEKTQLEIIQ